MDKPEGWGSQAFPYAASCPGASSTASIPKKTVRILTIDGGGLSSIIPVTILEKIEEQLRGEHPDQQIHLAHYFDIMAATSTSSILVLTLSAHLSAEDIARLYLASPYKLFCTSSSLSEGQPSYDAQALEATLQEFFGDKWLKESASHVLIPADNLEQKCAYLFDSHYARHPSYNFKVKDVARAACARLNDFSPVTIKDEKGMDDHTFADGERYAYDPTFEAIKVAEKEHPGCDLCIVSLGTGEAPRRFGDLILTRGDTIPLSQSSQATMRHQKDRHLGYLDYIKRAFKQQGRKVKYIRLQVPVDSSLIHASTLDSLKSLRAAGLSFTNPQHKKYKKFEKVLLTLKRWPTLGQVSPSPINLNLPSQEVNPKDRPWQEGCLDSYPLNNLYRVPEVESFIETFPQGLGSLEKAVKQNNSDAIRYLHRFYSKTGNTQDPVKAEEYRQLAQELGKPIPDLQSLENHNPETRLRTNINSQEKGEEKGIDERTPLKTSIQLVEWANKAAEEVDTEALLSLGLMYAEGRAGLPQGEQADQQAMKWFHKAAKKGNASALFNLGWMHAEGRAGLPQGEQADQQAVEWYKRAAEEGNSAALLNLGLMDAEGRAGLPQGEQADQQAVKWFHKAAKKGNASALFNLGWMHAQGRAGLPQGEQADQQAMEWYKKAAEEGDSAALLNLGLMYAQGRAGLPQGEQADQQAVEWFHKAAMKGNSAALLNLGLMYAQGRAGLPQGEQADQQAMKWFHKAAMKGNSAALLYLEMMHRQRQGV
jgi:TPR repeat protein/patatin-like phospholipase/acyl hydrolase